MKSRRRTRSSDNAGTLRALPADSAKKRRKHRANGSKKKPHRSERKSVTSQTIAVTTVLQLVQARLPDLPTEATVQLPSQCSLGEALRLVGLPAPSASNQSSSSVLRVRDLLLALPEGVLACALSFLNIREHYAKLPCLARQYGCLLHRKAIWPPLLEMMSEDGRPMLTERPGLVYSAFKIPIPKEVLPQLARIGFQQMELNDMIFPALCNKRTC
eukprot:g5501.t1